MKMIALILMTLTLVSCGVDGNSSRADKGKDTKKKRGTRDTQAATPEKVDYPNYLRSQAFRTRKSNQLTYRSTENLLKDGNPPSWLHFIPDPNKDVDSSIIKALAPESDCGLAKFGNIASRKSDCKSKNPATYYWGGKENGISGEGNWQLVGKKGKVHLWQDLTTGLVWTSDLGSTDWEKASGARGFEDEAYCRVEHDNASLGKIPSDQITWRLPTRNDFLQADLNGARFVLEELHKEYWTASHDGSSHAWSITQETGILQKSKEEELLAVRCVGIIRK